VPSSGAPKRLCHAAPDVPERERDRINRNLVGDVVCDVAYDIQARTYVDIVRTISYVHIVRSLPTISYVKLYHKRLNAHTKGSIQNRKNIHPVEISAFRKNFLLKNSFNNQKKKTADSNFKEAKASKKRGADHRKTGGKKEGELQDAKDRAAAGATVGREKRRLAF
jgi:hypothetical protein